MFEFELFFKILCDISEFFNCFISYFLLFFFLFWFGFIFATFSFLFTLFSFFILSSWLGFSWVCLLFFRLFVVGLVLSFLIRVVFFRILILFLIMFSFIQRYNFSDFFSIRLNNFFGVKIFDLSEPNYINWMDLKSQTYFKVTLVDIFDIVYLVTQQQLNAIIIFFVHFNYQVFTAFEWHFFRKTKSIFLFE